MEKTVYFDHAAASPPTEEVRRFQAGIPLKYFVNSEAVHSLAYQSREALKRAEKDLSELLLGRDDWPVIWGNSATELFRVAASLPEFTTSAATLLEHPALLTNLGKYTRFSQVPAKDIPAAAPDLHPVIPATHQVQSELGSMPDREKFFTALSPQCRLTDAVQAAGKMPLERNGDIQVISGVKFGAPGGAAMLLDPLGKFTDRLLAHAHAMRQNDYALSRINVPTILTMLFAAGRAVAAMEDNCRRISGINSFIRKECAGLGILPTVPADTPVSPYILNLLLPEQESAVVVRALSMRGVFVASGSACSAESGKPSAALTALGFPPQKAYRALRLSFGTDNTMEDAIFFLSELKNVLKNY